MSSSEKAVEPEWVDYLAALQKRIWSSIRTTFCACGCKSSFRHEVGNVTETEWKKLTQAVQEHGLVCEMTNACMGFGFGVRIYSSRTFPGTQAEHLLTVTTDHFDGSAKSRADGYDGEWGRFEKLVYAQRNLELLEFNGFEKPRSKSYYDY